MQPTLAVIDEVAEQLEQAAARVRARRQRLAQDGRLAESASAVLRPSRVRLDLLASRPVRSVQEAGTQAPAARQG